MTRSIPPWRMAVPAGDFFLSPRLPVLAATLVVLLMGTWLSAACWGRESDRTFTLVPLDSLSLAITGRATGVTWVGPDTLAILEDIPDSLSQSRRRTVHLVFQDHQGTVLMDQDFTGVLDRALAWDGEYLWGCGDNNEGGSLLYKIRLDSLLVDKAYDLSGHHPTGMCYDGRFLWITDRDSGRLDRFDPQSEAITRSEPGPAFSPSGVAWDGRQIWLTDQGTGRMYRLTGGRCHWTGTVGVSSFLRRDQAVLLMHDGFSLFYVLPGEHFAVKAIFR